MNQNKLQRKIMRGIYYSFAIRGITNPALILGFGMLAMLIALTHFVSIGNVINNLMGVQIGHLDRFLYNAVTNTEAWTLLIIGLLIFSALSLRFKLAPLHKAHKFVG